MMVILLVNLYKSFDFMTYVNMLYNVCLQAYTLCENVDSIVQAAGKNNMLIDLSNSGNVMTHAVVKAVEQRGVSLQPLPPQRSKLKMEDLLADECLPDDML